MSQVFDTVEYESDIIALLVFVLVGFMAFLVITIVWNNTPNIYREEKYSNEWKFEKQILIIMNLNSSLKT